MIAKALGAEIFERHIGLPADNITLNKYSSTPKQIDKWLDSLVFAQSALGNYKRVIDSDELESLNELKRSIYLKKPINVGSKIEKRDIYYCNDKQTNQVLSGEFKNGMILQKIVHIDDVL